MAKSDTGVWIDDDTGALVFSPPTHGTQIVQKGGEISGAAKSRLAAAGHDTSSIPGFSDEETTAAKNITPATVETATDNSEVETATVDTPKAKRATKK